MKTYKYQTHMHTYPCSKCGRMSPKEMVTALADGGYAGGVITNHFVNGNTGVDTFLPWREFVAAFENDYLECKREGEKIGIDIFFGVEACMEGFLEVLYYGITPQMLYDSYCLRKPSAQIWYETLSPKGVLAIQAHPFRIRNYIENPGVLPTNIIDGIEVFNAGNVLRDNLTAEEYARNHSEMILISGGDAHQTETVCHGGIETAEKLRDNKHLVEILQAGRFNRINE